MEDFYVKQFTSVVSRDHPVRFVYRNESRDILINLSIMSYYTTFFQEKPHLISDHVYMLPFSVSIAVDCIDHVHSLFSQLACHKHIHQLFELLEGFDYFCIDIRPVYLHILSTVHQNNIPVLRWTRDALRLATVPYTGVLINHLYDNVLSISIASQFTSVDYPVLEFLLSRKWVITPQTYSQVMNMSVQLERDLYFCVINFIEDIYPEDDVCGLFQRIWDLMLPYHLSIDILTHLSNTRLAPFIQSNLRVLLDQKLKLFSSTTPSLSVLTRFRLDTEHTDPQSLVLHQKIQVFYDTLRKWINGTVVTISSRENMCSVETDTGEIIEVSMVDRYRFFPYQTITVGKVCPCDGCMSGFRSG